MYKVGFYEMYITFGEIELLSSKTGLLQNIVSGYEINLPTLNYHHDNVDIQTSLDKVLAWQGRS